MKRLNGKIVSNEIDLPEGYRADQILTSGAFGLSDTRNIKVEKKIQKYRELSNKKRLSVKEKNKLKKLSLFTQALPEIAQYEEERQARSDLRNLIKQLKQVRSKGKQD
jgi:hypothetical protein